MEIRWLGEVCSALPSSGGRGHSCDHQAMPLIETLYVVETLYAIGYWPESIPKGETAGKLRAVFVESA